MYLLTLIPILSLLMVETAGCWGKCACLHFYFSLSVLCKNE